MPKPNHYIRPTRGGARPGLRGSDPHPRVDLIAEEGIAAHWRYKEGRLETRGGGDDQNIVWLRQLLEWQKDVQDPRTFLTTLKVDLYPDEVYVFTPKGDVLSFPRGATPLDFAYRGTTIRHHAVGRGSTAPGPLSTAYRTRHGGDHTKPNRNPSRDG